VADATNEAVSSKSRCGGHAVSAKADVFVSHVAEELSCRIGLFQMLVLSSLTSYSRRRPAFRSNDRSHQYLVQYVLLVHCCGSCGTVRT
jgi:hypothetical protein